MKVYTPANIKVLFILFLIGFGICLYEMKSREYLYDVYTSTINQKFGIRSADGACSEIKYSFLNSVIRENTSFDSLFAGCIKRDLTRHGVLSYLAVENFAGISCPEKVIKLAEKDMPQVALASFPGSGNTWFRHLIEYVSGIASTSVYCGVVRETFFAECKRDKSKTIVIKTHRLATNESIDKFDKAILIIRNPYDAILAEFNRRHANKTSAADREEFDKGAWTDRAGDIMPRKWKEHVVSWITQYTGPLHIVFYEKMKSNLYEELYGIAKFLGIKVTFQDLWCAGLNQEGNYKREKPRWLKTSVLYSPKMKEGVGQYIQEVSDVYTSKYAHKNPFFDMYYLM